MKKKMRVTSLLAFQELLPTLGNREMLVFQTIKKLQPCNNRMVQEYLGLKINCITGRTNSLKKANLIQIVKKDKCPYTNRLTDYYKITDWIRGLMT